MPSVTQSSNQNQQPVLNNNAQIHALNFDTTFELNTHNANEQVKESLRKSGYRVTGGTIKGHYIPLKIVPVGGGS